MTFRSFPLSSDLVSVPDGHYDGVVGAHKLVLQVTPKIRRLDAGDNTLGPDGADALFEHLSKLRAKYNSSSEVWGMTEINLARNEVGDVGVFAAVKYASKDWCLRTLGLQSNEAHLANVAVVVERLNASRLHSLSLQANPLYPTSVVELFDHLDAPTLRELHLSACGLDMSVVPAIVGFIKSKRSQKLGLLSLNMNSLGRRGVLAILDALDAANFSIQRIGVHSNESVAARKSDEEETGRDSDDELPSDDPKSLAYLTGKRVPRLQKRNTELTKRVRKAASRALAPSRIILHARAPTDEELAARVMDSAMPAPADGTIPPPPPHFPLLDLPAEVRELIARHTSGDPYAMSDAQWSRVRNHAEDADSLAHMARRMKRAEAQASGGEARVYKRREVRDAWLAERGCETWELENLAFWDKWA